MACRANARKGSSTEDPDLFDPFCDPDNPKMITFEDITAAMFRIRSDIKLTPCIKSHVSDIIGMDVYLKQDYLQYTGSFKERGARNALMLLSPELKAKGAVAASAGNHAQALSYHGALLGIPVTVVMPMIAPIMKIAKCRKYGANVVLEGADMTDAKKIALKLAKSKGASYINGYDHPDILAGQGTAGLEIAEQVPDLDACIVPAGGGGFLAGIAVALKTLKPQCEVIGVEAEKCPSFTAAMKAGKPVAVPCGGTIADGLQVAMSGVNTCAIGLKYVDKMVTVSEELISIAILRLVELEKCVVEGAGACALAALFSGELNHLKGKKVVLLLSGGNIDSTILGRCLERGLSADGRLIKFKVHVRDRPGGITELCQLLGTAGVTIKDLLHERAWIHSDVFAVEVKVVVETTDFEHAKELRKLLEANYDTLYFGQFPERKVDLPLF